MSTTSSASLPLVGVTILLAALPLPARPSSRDTEHHRPIAEFAPVFSSHAPGEIPSFSRQTGLACNVCHTAFPQLTSFGREFKLAGYTLTAKETITQSDADRTTLRLPVVPGLSAMLIGSMTSIAREQPGTQNTNIDFPQELGLFLGGAISPHLGGFLQVTYASADGSIAIDNVDLRYANQTRVGSKRFDFGFSLNNNPTVQDVWNTVPAWAFPYTGSETAPTPSVSTLIDDDLGAQVAGLGGYFLWNGFVYGELTAYRSAPQGSSNPPDSESTSTVKGVAPYWRVALQHRFGKHYLSLGTFGLSTRLFPEGVVGASDHFVDVGVDAQYEVPLAAGIFAAHTVWIHETQNLDATYAAEGAANAKNTLRSLHVDATWTSKPRVDLSVGMLTMLGDPDRVLYPPDPVTGSRTGSPESTGFLGEVAWRPWLNTRFAVRYMIWSRFNGAGSDYDGFGRSAADNNTLYVYSWLAF